MAKDLFDLDENLSNDNNGYKKELTKAKVLCIRGLYNKALEIYNKILDEDIENEGAYIGLLRVHSNNFNNLKNKEIEKDIEVIDSLFPYCKDPDYLSFKKKIEDKKQIDLNAKLQKEKEANQKAKERLEKEKANERAQFLKKRIYEYLDDVDNDFDKDEAINTWIKVLEEASSNTILNVEFRAAAIFLLGRIYDNLGDDKKAFEYYSKACEFTKKGDGYDHVKEYYYLGVCYCAGKGTKKNLAKAIEMFEAGAKEENPYYDEPLCTESLKSLKKQGLYHK